MARLVVHPGSPTAWEIQLRPGVNLIGRGLANDFKLPDPSVSGAHCEVLVSDGSVRIRDLGSTNGTFVNRAPVREAELEHGHTVHLGSVEMAFEGDGDGRATPPPVPQPRFAAPAAPRLSVAPVLSVTATESAPEELAPEPSPEPAPLLAGKCKHHPKVPGRFFCPKCRQFFCDLCVISRAAGGAAHKFCRSCGSECTAAQVQITRPAQQAGFFARIPGVFVYPFRGTGILILFVSTLVFAALEYMGSGFSILAVIFAIGYLFSYMQNIIHATANEEEEMPGLPGFDGLFGACFRLLGCVVMSFGLPLGLTIYAFFNEQPLTSPLVLGTLFLGCLYFPMALLAVAMKDSVLAANPLVVMTAIAKVPGEYLIAAILLAGVFGARIAGGLVVTAFSAGTYTTKDMSQLFIIFGLRAFWSFVTVYLLTVNMRLLGLLYLTKKHRLGWFSH